MKYSINMHYITTLLHKERQSILKPHSGWYTPTSILNGLTGTVYEWLHPLVSDSTESDSVTGTLFEFDHTNRLRTRIRWYRFRAVWNEHFAQNLHWAKTMPLSNGSFTYTETGRGPFPGMGTCPKKSYSSHLGTEICPRRQGSVTFYVQYELSAL